MKLWGRSVLAAALLLAGGKTVFARPMPAWPPAPMKRAVMPGRTTTWHHVVVSPNPSLKIHLYDKFDPVWWLENADDVVPPDWYLPDDPHRRRKWRFRNPFHNFTFYVIGIADKKFTRSGLDPEHNSRPGGGWNFAVARRGIVLFPFVAYDRPRLNFYFGWRERGAFGLEFKLHRHATMPAKAQVCLGSSAGGFASGD